jgi:hypothetical protein
MEVHCWLLVVFSRVLELVELEAATIAGRMMDVAPASYLLEDVDTDETHTPYHTSLSTRTCDGGKPFGAKWREDLWCEMGKKSVKMAGRNKAPLLKVV